MVSSPQFSLIVGSVGRFDKLRRLLTSLSEQRNTNFELFVVEQQDAVGAEALVKSVFGSTDPRVKVITCKPGLSRARNTALRLSRGTYLAFPDDDCWYDPDTLDRAAAAFATSTDVDLVIGVQLTEAGEPVIPTPTQAAKLTRQNVWQIAMSSALFCQADAARSIGTFDPLLGVGSGTHFGSAEETEWVLRALAHGFTGEFRPDLTIRHPTPDQVAGRLGIRVGFRYGMGMGHVLRRHNYRLLKYLTAVLRPVAGSAVAFIRADLKLAMFRLSTACGRARGYWYGQI